MVIPRSDSAAVTAAQWPKESAKMTSSWLEDNLRICAFRLITEDLLKKGLITQNEAAKIRKSISKMEANLIKDARPQETAHLREQSAA